MLYGAISITYIWQNVKHSYVHILVRATNEGKESTNHAHTYTPRRCQLAVDN